MTSRLYNTLPNEPELSAQALDLYQYLNLFDINKHYLKLSNICDYRAGFDFNRTALRCLLATSVTRHNGLHWCG